MEFSKCLYASRGYQKMQTKTFRRESKGQTISFAVIQSVFAREHAPEFPLLFRSARNESVFETMASPTKKRSAPEEQDILDKVKAVLLDIEGTTTPLTFVKVIVSFVK